MNLDELKAERYKVKNDLEGILGTFRLSKSEVYFVHSKDIQFIKELLQQVDSHYKEQIIKVNTGAITEEEVVSYNISSGDRKILNRIIEHAEQYRESGIVKYRRGRGIVKYRIQDQYMTSQKVKEAIKKYLNSKFLSQSNFSFLSSNLHHLDKHNLSAEQTIIIEGIFDKVDEKTKKEEAGIIYFDPTGEPEINDIGNRLINCALGRGRIQNTVSTEDVLEVKDKYFREGEAGLDELGERLRIEMKGRINCRTFSQYEPVIKLLEKYMAAIDPNLYVINGLKSATPIHLVQ